MSTTNSPSPSSGPGASDSDQADRPASLPNSTPIPGAKKYKPIGDFNIVQKLGRGGMGSVYLAVKMSTGEQVALKILLPELVNDPEMYERFKREARATQRFSHPNIVSAVDFGNVEKYHYIAMQYVDGPDLEKLLASEGIFGEEKILRVAFEMALALEEIEKQGIVHRDMKPSNIMVTSAGVHRLTDLGLSSAGAGDQRVTMAGSAIGTPFYISPEQAKGDMEVDIRADIYGLGATLYHLATGSVPFPGNNDVVIMTAHLKTPLTPPEAVEPSVSPCVSALIQRMMEKDPAQRPQTAAELKCMIEQCQRGEIPTIATKEAEAPAKAKGFFGRLFSKA